MDNNTNVLIVLAVVLLLSILMLGIAIIVKLQGDEQYYQARDAYFQGDDDPDTISEIVQALDDAPRQHVIAPFYGPGPHFVSVTVTQEELVDEVSDQNTPLLLADPTA